MMGLLVCMECTCQSLDRTGIIHAHTFCHWSELTIRPLPKTDGLAG
jgi:hypothetical protein